MYISIQTRDCSNCTANCFILTYDSVVIKYAVQYNNKYLLNYCNNIAHLCLRASQSLFIRRKMHGDQLPFTMYQRVDTRLAGHRGVDTETEGWIPGWWICC